MARAPEVKRLLEALTGLPAPLRAGTTHLRRLGSFLRGASPLGYSQFNELLLLLGYDRVSRSFFQYLVDERAEYEPGASIGSLEALEVAVVRFRKLALLAYGSVTHAFQVLSMDSDALEEWLVALQPVPLSEFEQRNPPVVPIQRIEARDSYLLGYLMERDLRGRLEANPSDAETLALEDRRQQIAAVGSRNHQAYLASDHLDVYVATSMRERHEYLLMSATTERIFSDPCLAPLKLRWFDPTQAYCADRIDKGLSEALMLKRAKCTVYFAQESDTLGKDSELATTLAQGKVVIAFVPQGNEGHFNERFSLLREAYPERPEAELILEQLRVFEPGAAWESPEVATWAQDPAGMPIEAGRERLARRICEHFDNRAELLGATHPLGIQVNLATGVANGVLVVRTESDCAELIRRVVTRTLEFDLEPSPDGKDKNQTLKERVSKCVFRVVTADAMLTNTFWNFYLDPSD